MELEDFKMTNKLLGIGAFGSVQLAKNTKNNNYYAIKIINLNKLQGPNEQAIIRKEALIHSKLNHKHIIKFHQTLSRNNTLFHVLEYAEKGSLYRLIKKKQRIPESQIFKYFYQVLLAMKYLHDNDIMHRDIKPENLLLDKTDAIKLCDFGWSDTVMTEMKRQFCGTYEYMAPEIADRKPHNYKVDIWSLGVLLYELIYLHTPFRDNNEMDKKIIMENIMQKEPVFDDIINENAKELILSLLNKNPEKRPDIKEVLASKWIQKKLYSLPLKVNECIRSKNFHLKPKDFETKSKSMKKINQTLVKSSTTQPVDHVNNKRKSIFEKISVYDFPYSSNEITSVLAKPPLSATKHKSFLFCNITNTIENNRIFTEEGDLRYNEQKEKNFKNQMLNSMKTLECFEKRKKSELTSINESSFAEVSEEGAPNQVNLFMKNNLNKELSIKNT